MHLTKKLYYTEKIDMILSESNVENFKNKFCLYGFQTRDVRKQYITRIHCLIQSFEIIWIYSALYVIHELFKLSMNKHISNALLYLQFLYLKQRDMFKKFQRYRCYFSRVNIIHTLYFKYVIRVWKWLFR